MTQRQQQIVDRLGLTDHYSDLVFNLINAATFAYVGYKQIKNPQRHLVILCFLFGTAALTSVVEEILLITKNKNNPNFDSPQAAVAILNTAGNISFCVGHWKFVWQFFISAIDTKRILWNGISWHLEKIRHFRVKVDWSVSAFIIISLLASFLT
jgi:hypothetical protein